jgi:hypothetical protein
LNSLPRTFIVTISPGKNSLSCLAYPIYGITAITSDDVSLAFEINDNT